MTLHPQAHSWPILKPGVLERWYLAQPTPRVAAILIELPQSYPAAAHARALGSVTRAHPRLTWLAPESTRSGFRLAAAGQLLPLQVGGQNEGLAVCAHWLHGPFDAQQPLFRLELLQGGKLVVATFHHAIADGLSTAIFARDYVRALNGDAPSGPDGYDALPLDARMWFPRESRALLQELSAELSGKGSAYYAGTREEVGPLTSQLHAKVLDANLVEGLAGQASRQGTTVHGALCAAALHAAQLASGRSELIGRVTSPVSLRDACKPMPQGLGVFLCAVDADHHVKTGTVFWDLAQACRSAVADGKERSLGQLSLLRLVRDMGKTVAARAKGVSNGRTATVEVSNLGRVEIGHGARALFTQGNHYAGPLYNLSVLTDRDSGEMSIVLSTPHPLVSEAEGPVFLDRLQHTLELAATTQDLRLS